MKTGFDYWKDGFAIVKKDAVMWMAASIVAAVLNILPGVGLVSLFHMARKTKRGEKITIGDAVFGLSKIGPSVTAGLAFYLPFFFMILPGLYFGPRMMYAFPLIASGRETDGMASIKKSMELVEKFGGFGSHFVTWLLLGILGGIGSVACCIGMFFTAPCAIIGWNNALDDMMAGGVSED